MKFALSFRHKILGRIFKKKNIHFFILNILSLLIPFNHCAAKQDIISQ